MKVVILNSGLGARMGELTAGRPKCLAMLNHHDTILSRQIKILKGIGIKKVLITTGPFEEQIKEHMQDNFTGINFTFVHNPDYRATNYIYSLLLTKEHITDDIILMHGDMVFDAIVLRKLLQSAHRDAVLVNAQAELPQKDFKGEIQSGRVRRIAVDIFGENCVFLFPIYKLSRDTFRCWLKEMELFRANGRLQVYAEDALNNLLDEHIVLNPVYLKDEFCMEIDDAGDLAVAQKYFQENRRPVHGL